MFRIVKLVGAEIYHVQRSKQTWLGETRWESVPFYWTRRYTGPDYDHPSLLHAVVDQEQWETRAQQENAKAEDVWEVVSVTAETASKG